MPTQFTSVDEYLQSLPDDRKDAITKLRNEILKNLPDGFEEQISYGTIGYVVPHSKYPDGYHCDTTLPLPFLNLASQKSHIAVYHMGIYADEKLLQWFVKMYQNVVGKNPDMGKSCIRFKKLGEIPYDLIGELASKITAVEWIKIYEKNYKR